MSKQELKRILIVDDEPDIVLLLQTLLGEYGFEVVTASNGQEAIEVLKTDSTISLILSDLIMPELDGRELLKWVRANDQNKPFVVMSGANRDTDEELMKMGVDALFEKPFDPNAIVDFVRDYFEDHLNRTIRKFPRRKLKSPMVITALPNQDHYSGICLNIGQGGLFVTFKPPFPQHNSLVKFEMREETGSSIFGGHGIVRWHRESIVNGQLPGIGIEFTMVDAEGVSFLNKLV